MLVLAQTLLNPHPHPHPHPNLCLDCALWLCHLREREALQGDGADKMSIGSYLRTKAVRGGSLLALFGVASAAASGAQLLYWSRLTKHKFVLHLNLDKVSISESPGSSLLQSLSKRSESCSLLDVGRALRAAADDEKCTTFVMTGTGAGANDWLRTASVANSAMVQELSSAIFAFRGRGKDSMAHSSTYGEMGASNGMYQFVLASACKKVYMQPTGYLSLMGMNGRAPFFGGFLQKLNIEPIVFRRSEYKNALNNLSETAYTSAHKEATAHLLQIISNQAIDAIATARSVQSKTVKANIDKAPINGEDSIKIGLIDGLLYTDQIWKECGIESESSKNEETKDMKFGAKVMSMISGRDNKTPRVITIPQYVKFMKATSTLENFKNAWKSVWTFSSKRKDDKGNENAVVALHYLQGPIVDGEQTSKRVIGAATQVKTLSKLRKAKNVKAVVLRVDSPGGSAIASDAIWREVKLLKDAGKPVIISMGNVAASGGYFISAPATKIYAMPGTLTGSIGVILGKFNFEGFLNDQGITLDEVENGKNANMLSITTGLTKQQKNKLNTMIDEVYNDFLSRVVDGRNMKLRNVQQVAKGRVWTGEDAYRLGLVDELGDLDAAIQFANESVGLDSSSEVMLVKDQSSWVQELRNSLTNSSLQLNPLLLFVLGNVLNVGHIDLESLKALSQFHSKAVVLEPDFLFD